MKKAFRILSLLATGLAVVGCQDFENGFSAQEIKNAEYAAHFEKVFGTPDPNQDWSMATLVKANVNLPGLTGTAKMNICTGDPRNSETRLLAQIMLKDGKGYIDFDAIKGSENVFVTVEQDGEYKVFSQYALQNGMLNIGEITPEMLLASAPLTRAFSGTCPTTQRTDADGTRDYTYFGNIVSTTKIDGIKYPKTDGYTNSSNLKTLADWVTFAKTGGGISVQWDEYAHNITNNTPFTDESTTKFIKIASTDFSSLTTSNLKDGATTNSEDIIYWKVNSDEYYKTLATWKSEVEGDEFGTYVNTTNSKYPFVTNSVIQYTDPDNTWKGGIYVWDHYELKSDAEEIPAGQLITYKGIKKSFSAWMTEVANNLGEIRSGSFDGPWDNALLLSCINMIDCDPSADGSIYAGLTDESTWDLKDSAEPHFANVCPTFQYLSNVEKSEASNIDMSTFFSFFGDGRFFAESKSVWEAEKLGVFYDDETMLKMEKGYSVVTTEGQVIELPYVFGCTAYTNQFGYIYYKAEDEANIDPIDLKHYVLIEDGRPNKNIYYSDGTSPVGSGNGSLSDWNRVYKYTLSDGSTVDLTMNGTYPYRNDPFVCACNSNGTGIYGPTGQHLPNCYSPAERYAWVAAQGVHGTTYRPMFFGEDGNASQGTYEWPAGYKIVFWINTLKTDAPESTVADTYVRDHPANRFTSDAGLGGHFNYSLPTLNKRLFHNYQGSLGAKHTDLDTFGQVQAISWTIDGATFLAFGDVSTDKDLNDMVFMISAPNSNPENTVVVAPVKWHLNYNSMHEDTDLFDSYALNIGATYTNPTKTSEGSTVPAEPSRYGYTFVGWSLSDPTASTGSKSINGTIENSTPIHYYAIWEPVGETVKIRWHLNYNGTHNDDHDGAGNDVYATNTVAKNTGKYSKPATDPSYSDATMVFKGWAATPIITSDSELLPDASLTNVTAGNEDVCYYAIWGPAPTPTPDPDPITWILACEDLGGSFDYDFNDVVWSVQTSWSGGTPTTKVKVLAAGGTLGFALKYKETLICNKGNAFTASTTDEQVVNAGASNGVNRTPNEFTLTTAITTISTEWQQFSVVVKDHGDSQHVVQNIKKSTENSKAPQIILLPEEWEWPTELTPINEAYTNFTTWVTNNTAATWENWRTNKVENKTVSRSATHN